MKTAVPTESLQEKIRRLILAKISAVSAARAARKAAEEAEYLTLIKPEERQVVREARRFADHEVAQVEMELSTAQAQVRREQLLANRPALVAKIQKAKALAERRDKIADRCQSFLEQFSDSLVELDECTAALHVLCKDPNDRGVTAIGATLSPIHASARLIPSLAGAIGATSYRRAVKQPLLAPKEESFSLIEREVTRSAIFQLTRQLQELDEESDSLLSKKGEVA